VLLLLGWSLLLLLLLLLLLPDMVGHGAAPTRMVLLLLPGVVGHCAARSSTKLARQIIPPIKNGQVRCKNVHGALWHASSSSYRKGT